MIKGPPNPIPKCLPRIKKEKYTVIAFEVIDDIIKLLEDNLKYLRGRNNDRQFSTDSRED